jgi:hypothetical protein
MKPQTNEAMTGLLEWAGPVIYDRLRIAYEMHLPDRLTAMSLAKSHARVWRALLSGDMQAFEALRADMVLQLVDRGLTLDHLAEADADTMTELLEIVIARFRRSPGASRNYHLALMRLATYLGPAEMAA